MGKVRRPDGAIKGESVVPLSKGISEGIMGSCNGSPVGSDKIITSRNADVIRIRYYLVN